MLHQSLLIVILTLLLVSIFDTDAFSNILYSQSTQSSLPSLSLTALSASKSATKTLSDTSRLKRVTNLVDWANGNGIKLTSSIAIEQSDGENNDTADAGLGIIATDDIPISSNSVAMTVPSNVALAIEYPKGNGPDGDNKLFDNYFTNVKSILDMAWYVQFSLYINIMDLLTSSKKGDKDNVINMKPWLDTLPRRFNTPIHWSSTIRDEMQYNYLYDSISNQEKQWRNYYNTINGMISDTTLKSKLSLEQFIWGMEIARSRAFSSSYTGNAFNPLPFILTLFLVVIYVGLGLGTLEQAANGAALVLCGNVLSTFVLPKFLGGDDDKKKTKYVICPIIDMCNHKSLNFNGDVSFEYFIDAYSLATTGTGSDGNNDVIKKESELFISYGKRSNDQLLQYYGFVEPDNPNDVYVMKPLREWDIDTLEDACGRKFSLDRLQKLENAGLLGSIGNSDINDDSDDYNDKNKKGNVVITKENGIDPAIMSALRVLVSTDDEWNSNGQAVGNFVQTTSGGLNNEKAANLVARTALQNELSEKQTTIEEDKELLNKILKQKSSKSKLIDNGDDIEQMILAIMFRMEKKKILLETIAKL